jgi:DeoR/GlpR family transcriptional regulator of sugar metabolism
MNQRDRFKKILYDIQEKGEIKVTDLMDELGVSGATIRSDIRELDRKKRLKRIYGGAVKIPEEEILTVKFEAGKFYKCGHYKRSIAEHAFVYIEDGDTIMLDDSTTCAYLAQVIYGHPEKKLTVVTNSLYDAALLSSVPHVSVYIGGGSVSGRPAAVMDAVTAKNFGSYHVQKFFTGIHGIDLNTGLNSSDMVHMRVKQQMINSSEQLYVLADASKFGKSGLFTVCELKAVYRFITDNTLKADIREKIKRQGLEVDYVSVEAP